MENRMFYLIVGLLVVVATVPVLTGCTGLEAIGSGGVLGGTLGGIVGHQTGHRTEGAVIGAIAGMLAGGAYYDLDRRLLQTEEELQRANTIYVRIQAQDGTFRDVRLDRHPEGWMGPQGEVYPGPPPTPEQLKKRYSI